MIIFNKGIWKMMYFLFVMVHWCHCCVDCWTWTTHHYLLELSNQVYRHSQHRTQSLLSWSLIEVDPYSTHYPVCQQCSVFTQIWHQNRFSNSSFLIPCDRRLLLEYDYDANFWWLNRNRLMSAGSVLPNACSTCTSIFGLGSCLLP